MSSSLFSQQRSSSQGGALTRQPERGGKECPKLLIIGLRALLSLLGQLGVIVHCFRGSKAGIMQCDILLKILAINFFFFCYRWQPICSRPGPTQSSSASRRRSPCQKTPWRSSLAPTEVQLFALLTSSSPSVASGFIRQAASERETLDSFIFSDT